MAFVPCSEGITDALFLLTVVRRYRHNLTIKIWFALIHKSAKKGGKMKKILSKEEMDHLFSTADFLKWNIKIGFEAILFFNEIPHDEWGLLEEETKEDIYESIEKAVDTAGVTKEFIKDIIGLSFVDLNDEGSDYADFQWLHLPNKEVVELLQKHGY